MISPFIADQGFARHLVPEGRFLEIYVRCEVEECARCAPKGLYARARRGEIAESTGISSPDEAAPSPELIVDTGAVDPEAAARQLLAELVRRGIVAAK